MRRACLPLILSLVCACGDGTLIFGAGDDSNPLENLVVDGTINNVVPVTTRDIVVFVFTNLRDFVSFSDFDDGEAVIVAFGSTQFSVSGVTRGDLTVVFLLDDADPDGQIDTGDPVALLQDPDGVLDNVSPGRQLRIDSIDIDFSAGTADADSITASTIP
ncbi:MAG: hypothetical protein ACE5E4_02065 [Candidatus Binatia bacterium]